MEYLPSNNKGLGHFTSSNESNSRLARCYVLESWRRAKVAFIPKIGKKGEAGHTFFRPIGLTFSTEKIEKILDKYI